MFEMFCLEQCHQLERHNVGNTYLLKCVHDMAGSNAVLCGCKLRTISMIIVNDDDRYYNIGY